MQSDVTLMIQPVAVTAHQLRNDELGSTPATGAGDRKEGTKEGSGVKKQKPPAKTFPDHLASTMRWSATLCFLSKEFKVQRLTTICYPKRCEIYIPMSAM